MKYAFPEDELRPLTCGPLTRDRDNPARIELNDVLGNYSLTLIDSLSTLAILASSPPSGKHPNRALKDFQDGVALLIEHYGDGSQGPGGQGKRARGFDVDSKVQVFETVIRGVGGLLSAHLFAAGELPIRGYRPIVESKRGKTGIFWRNGLVYDGQLLRLALDLAERLLPAFHTATGLPYPRVNLRHGIPFYANSPLNMDPERGQCPTSPPTMAEITETCSAGAGSLVLEFTTLSRLTGDSRFENVAKQAFWAVWLRRSSVGLIGSGIDVESGHWVSPYTGIGAGIDSFFEYAFKSYVLLSGMPYNTSNPSVHSPEAFLETWQEAHAAIKRHVYRGEAFQHPHYLQVDLYTGALRALWVDSLSAYYPGLLTLAGELEEAITTHLLYTALWTRYSALPERWSTATGTIEAGLRWWIGRPEFIESTWYLYRATKDPWYLYVGEMTLRDIKRRCWTKCGWAGLQDVRSGEKMDRMESFFLGETAKYLFLLFDEDHPLNHLDAPVVFTTEGHPLIVPRKFGTNGLFTDNSTRLSQPHPLMRPPVCPLPPPNVPLSFSSTAARKDLFHAASLARLHLMPSIETLESPLVEFTADHPSISVSDLTSPSNYTYFPWTLPPQFVPPNADCSLMATRTTFDLSFPNLPEKAPRLGALQRVFDGILISSMSGLRLGMVKESVGSMRLDESDAGDHFRIYAVSNIALGRDEKVFLIRDLVSDFNPADPYFTRTRDLHLLDVVLDIANNNDPAPTDFDTIVGEDMFNASILPLISLKGSPASLDAKEGQSLISGFLSNIQSMLIDSLPANTVSTAATRLSRHFEPASVSSGPGAAPLHDMDDLPPFSDDESHLPWQSIYIAGQLCGEGVLPTEVPKENQILIIERGGCSFSEKLRNVPSFAPSPNSLQLVIIVSFPSHDNPEREQSGQGGDQQQRDDDIGEEGLIQPYLDQIQMTPAGIPRPHPIPMIMVGGGEETIDRFRRAKGVAIRRRWWFESQGIRIGNLIVL